MGYKILLADDSVTVQKIITLTFSDEGVDVQTVNNGDEAINRLQYMRPALVMADVSIPGKNGYDICEFVKNHPEMKDTPVVLLVPAFEPFDEERARRIGANQHLTKPFQSIRTLISTVKGLLESHPPKINAPLTPNAAGTGNLSLAKPIEEKKAEAEAVQPTPAVAAPPTQPFPPDTEEQPPLISTENLLKVEAEPEQPEPGPVLEMAPEPEPIADVLDVQAEVAEVFVEQIEPQISAEDFIPTIEPIPAEEATISAAPIHNDFSDDLDHVLDLDDVLPEVWPQPSPVAVSSAQASVQAGQSSRAPHALAAESANDFHAATQMAIPQTVIDEIVNRVVAQLSEKLTTNLAAQLAPEVAEIVKQQAHQAEAAPSTFAAAPISQDSDSLLDLN